MNELFHFLLTQISLFIYKHINLLSEVFYSLTAPAEIPFVK